jgi:ectoine hydrolase
MQPAFETTEYRSRLDSVRRLMAESGLDALLVINEGNMNYLTGYEGYSESAPQAVLVTLDDDPYIILRDMDVRCAEGSCWLPQERLIGYDESYIGTADRSGWDAVGEFVKTKIAATARIGAELSRVGRNGGLTAEGYLRLLGALGIDQLQDATRIVPTCKQVKSERELAYITEAAAIVDQAMLAGVDKIGVGVRQSDVAATIMSNLIAGTETIPGGPSFSTPWMTVGPVGGFANAPHLKWTDEVYKAGQQTNLELGAYRRRYACCLARTAFLGTPSTRLKDIHKGVVEGWLAAIDSIRPGVACSDVAQAFGTAIQPFGIKKASRIGYSLGVDWMDGGPSLAANDQTEIVTNMTFHVLIGIWNQGEGYSFSETVRVTEDGAKSLSNVPRALFEISA